MATSSQDGAGSLHPTPREGNGTRFRHTVEV
jgi:hypothetical protein